MNSKSSSGHKHRRRIPIYRQIIFLLIVTVAFIALVEGGLRLVGDPDANIQFFQEHEVDTFILDILWIPDAFTATNVGKAIASRPFNDRRKVSKEKPDDVLRIVCLGGSVTQGYDFDVKYSFPMQLEQILNEQYDLPLKVEVNNGGNLGGNSYSGLFYFDNLIRSYSPDIVTLLFTVNDYQSSAMIGLFMSDHQYVETHRRIQESKNLRELRTFMQSLSIYKWSYRLILWVSKEISLAYRFDVPDHTYFPPRVAPDVYKKTINGFVDLAEEDGFEVVPMYEGNNRSDYTDGVNDIGQPYWEALKDISEKRNVPLLIPDRVFSQFDQSRESFYFDAVHMTKQALRIYAEQLAKDLMEAGVIDRALAKRGFTSYQSGLQENMDAH